MHKTTQIPLTVSPRVLETIPRMFGSFNAVLAEIFQNAYRAGAETVWVTVDGRKVVIRDDGRGIEDPAAFFTAGDTGWDETEVIEPAGVGAYALLSERWIEQVEVQTSTGVTAWRAVVSPQNLASRSVSIEELDAASVARGTCITLYLQEDVSLYRDKFVQARAYYPYRVIYRDKDGEADLEPLRLRPRFSLQTPAGRVDLYSAAPVEDRAAVVWEWRPITSENFKTALSEAAATCEEYPFAQRLLRYVGVELYPCKDSGVRPRLPDRSEIVLDEALRQAAREVVNAIGHYFIETIRPIVEKWPDVVWISYGWHRDDAVTIGDLREEAEVDAWIDGSLFSEAASAVAEHLGWRKIVQTDLETYDAVYSHDDLTIWVDTCRMLVRPSRLNLVAHRYVAHSLFNQGVFAVVDDRGEGPVFEGLSVSSECPIAVARSIRVGDLAVDWLAVPDCDEWGIDALDQAPVMVIAGRPENIVLSLLKGGQGTDIVAKAFAQAMIDEDPSVVWDEEWMTENDNGGYSLDVARVVRTMVTKIVWHYASHLKQTCYTFYAVADVVDAVRDVLHHLLYIHAMLGRSKENYRHARVLRALLGVSLWIGKRFVRTMERYRRWLLKAIERTTHE